MLIIIHVYHDHMYRWIWKRCLTYVHESEFPIRNSHYIQAVPAVFYYVIADELLVWRAYLDWLSVVKTPWTAQRMFQMN